jgi:hypothetical protein
MGVRVAMAGASASDKSSHPQKQQAISAFSSVNQLIGNF